MRVIDAHVHLYPPEANRAPAAWAAEQREAHWAVLATRRRKDGRAVQEFPPVEDLLRAMDAAGIERSVLLGWYWEQPGTCRLQNRFYAACVRAHPDRLSACATLHPAAGAAAREELRWAREAGFSGLGELSPHSQHFACDDPAWGEILDEAGEFGLPVNLHVTDPQSRPFPGRVDTPPGDFLRLADAHPRTTFILAHWGGGLAWSADALARPNLLFDTAASPLLYGPEAWGRVPPGRVLFGSDYPLVLHPRRESRAGVGALLQEARDAGADDATLGGNAARCLRLPPRGPGAVTAGAPG